jgi:hypothetical protein
MTFKIYFHPDFNCWYRSFNGSTFGLCLRVADFTASGDFHPAPEILTVTKIIKKIYQVLKRGEKITLENRDRPWSP